MIRILDLDKETANLQPVTTSEIFIGKSASFHPDGLFSEKIFGASETPERRKTFSYINLNTVVLHPAIYPIMRRLERKILDAITIEKRFRLEKGTLIEDPDGDISGIKSVVDNFSKIRLRSEDKKVRSDYIKMINFYHKRGLIFINKVLVIPPAYRDVIISDTGEISINPTNEYYIKIIRLSQQLRSIQEGPVFDVLSSRMHTLVLDLYNYFTSKISKKGGLLRQNMLGKRVDFTARAVISGSASEINPDEIGVPFKLLVKMFEPFLIYDILNSGLTNKELLSQELEKYNGSPLNALSLRKLFLGVHKHDEIPDSLREILKDSLSRAIDGKVVLAKRDPALHAESVQAFKPKIVDGNTIKLHPIKCSAFNADFDGDQMALYVPITRQAIEEAREKMIVSKSKDGFGQLSDSFEKDIVIGIYSLTMEPKGRIPSITSVRLIKRDEDVTGLDIYSWVNYAGVLTTVGRVLFNLCFPSGVAFINESINKKRLNQIAEKVYDKFGRDIYNEFSSKVCKLAFKYGTITSPSFSIDDLEIPKDIFDLKSKIAGSTPEEAQKIIDIAESKLKQHLETKRGSLGTIGLAGGLKGGYSQTRQILFAKGLLADNTGKIMDPVGESYGEGINSKDFFMTGAGTRKGISDRVLNTADTGYLTRQLVYALQRVEADPSIYNCGTKKSFQVKVTPDIAKRLTGRYILDSSGNPVAIKDPSKMIGMVIPLKSPLFCLSPKLCKTCYGELVTRNHSQYVGMLAAQIFGERGTQLIMRTFHTGGAVSVVNIDIRKMIFSQYDKSQISKFDNLFSVHDSKVSCKENCVLRIKKFEYTDPSKDIHYSGGNFQLAYGYFDLIVGNEVFPITLDVETNVFADTQNVADNTNEITIRYVANSDIFFCPPITDSFLDKVKIIRHLFSGKKPFRSPGHFVMKIYDQYYNMTDSDLVHFEVLASHFLRDFNNPSYPARMNKDYKARIISLKKIPQVESWLSALSFENPSESISTGLVYDRDHDDSVLEQIVNGTL